MKVVYVVMPFADAALPCLEVAQMVGLARQYGYQAEVADLNVALWNELKDSPEARSWSAGVRMRWSDRDFSEAFWRARPERWRAFREDVASRSPDLVCFWVSATSLHLSTFMAKEIKEVVGAPVLAVNPHLVLGAFWDPQLRRTRIQHFLESCSFDGVVHGPFYDPIMYVFRDVEERRPVQYHPGVHSKGDGRVMLSPRPNPLVSPDRLPFADFSAFELGLYGRRDALPYALFSGCGCPHCLRLGMGPDHAVFSGVRLFMEAMHQRRRFPDRKAMAFVERPGPKAMHSLRHFARMILDNQRATGTAGWHWEAELDAGSFPQESDTLFPRSGWREPEAGNFAGSNDGAWDALLLPTFAFPTGHFRPAVRTVSARVPSTAAYVEGLARFAAAHDRLSSGQRPAEAVEEFLRLWETSGNRAAYLALLSFEADMKRLWSALKLLCEADAARRTAASEGVGRASRFLAAANSRLARVRCLTARAADEPETGRYSVRWGESALSINRVFRMCRRFFSALPNEATSWAEWHAGKSGPRAELLRKTRRVPLLSRAAGRTP